MTILENNKDYGIKVFENFVTDEDCNYLINFLNNADDETVSNFDSRKITLRPESETIKNLLLKVLDKASQELNNKNLFIRSYIISS